MENNLQGLSGKKSKMIRWKKKYRIAVGAVVVLAVLYFGWTNYWNSDARSDRELAKNYAKFEKGMNDFETAMRNDTYGGKTPQETLDMFISALKKGDVELASKYFILETNTKDENYLTRNEWIKALGETKSENGFSKLISVLEKAVPTKDQDTDLPNVFWYSVYDENDEITYNIEMNLNTYSNIWKIDSL